MMVELERSPNNSNPPLKANGTTWQPLERFDTVDEPPLERAPSSQRSRGTDPDRPNEQHDAKEQHLALSATASLLILATIWGVLARLGLTWIGPFSETEVFPLIWAQVVGCLIMGAVTERKSDIESIYPPLFAALGTGFCGSLTTFSSWMYDVFLGFGNINRPGFGRYQGFMAGLSITVVTLGLSTAALRTGVHLASFLPALPPKPRPNRLARAHGLAIAIGPIFWLGAAFLLAFGPHSWRHRATFAIVLGPPGTLLRFYLSRRLNSLRPSFPIGTFTANTLAVLVEAVIAVLQRREGTSNVGCAALQGVMDGFCGSLSTVSTFVVELRGLSRRDSYVYFFASWMAAQLLMVLILGSWVWSGDRADVCAP